MQKCAKHFDEVVLASTKSVSSFRCNWFIRAVLGAFPPGTTRLGFPPEVGASKAPSIYTERFGGGVRSPVRGRPPMNAAESRLPAAFFSRVSETFYRVLLIEWARVRNPEV